MKKNCFDEGLLQAFWDNELNPEMSQKVAQHVAVCDFCAASLANIEEETLTTFSALESEFNTLVPTQRLWAKINESIEAEQRHRSMRQRMFAPVSAIVRQISKPSMAAMAGLLVVFASFAVLLTLKSGKNEGKVAANLINQPLAVPEPEKIASGNTISLPSASGKKESNENQNIPTPQFRFEKADFVPRDNSRKVSVNFLPHPKNEARASVSQYIAGEENYVKTISRLENAVNENKDIILNPSERFLFEKDLAVVNDSISRMKKEIRKNPKNEAARQVLFASYQNKIELLNSVTERGALMAIFRRNL